MDLRIDLIYPVTGGRLRMINRCIRIRADCSVPAVLPIITFFNFDELKYFDRSFNTLVNISLSYLQIFDVKNHYWLKSDPIISGIHYTTSGRFNALLKDFVTKVISFQLPFLSLKIQRPIQ